MISYTLHYIDLVKCTILPEPDQIVLINYVYKRNKRLFKIFKELCSSFHKSQSKSKSVSITNGPMISLLFIDLAKLTNPDQNPVEYLTGPAEQRGWGGSSTPTFLQ